MNDVSHTDLAEKIGELRGHVVGIEAQISSTKNTVSEIRTEVAVLRDAISQAKGGWKLLIAISALAGAAGALMSKLLVITPLR